MNFEIAKTTAEDACRLVEANAETFACGFGDWLRGNFAIWVAFAEAASYARWRGYKRYSARRILEELRYSTALRESGSRFKLNNNVAPDLARLYLLFYPEAKGFFETRSIKAA